jgi:hypothetical protein
MEVVVAFDEVESTTVCGCIVPQTDGVKFRVPRAQG